MPNSASEAQLLGQEIANYSGLVKTVCRRRFTQPTDEIMRARCLQCGHDVPLLTGKAAARILAVEEKVLDRLLAKGQLYGRQTVTGRFLICEDSLFL